jgi:regulator of replication initiation timing
MVGLSDGTYLLSETHREENEKARAFEGCNSVIESHLKENESLRAENQRLSELLNSTLVANTIIVALRNRIKKQDAQLTEAWSIINYYAKRHYIDHGNKARAYLEKWK